MCGICGVRRFGPEPISADQIEILLVENQRRGNHATGLALQQADGSIDVLKAPVPAWEFVATEEYKAFIEKCLRGDTLTFIGHTRQATVGDPKHNKNNHPMWAGKTAVVHNGGITNHGWMFDQIKIKREAETDSDILRGILDEFGFSHKAFKAMNRLSGSAAFAAISTAHPGKLVLARSGNPIELAGTDDHMIWSSERSPIYKACRPFEKRFGIWMRRNRADVSFMPMNNDSVYCIGDRPKDGSGETWQGDWLEWHQELKIAYNGWTGHTYNVNGTYRGMRIRVYGDQQVSVVRCPNTKCGEYIPTDENMLKNLKNYKCKKCKTRLAPEAA